jgi:hypothetical protein
MEEEEKDKERDYNSLRNNIDLDYVVKSNEAKRLLEIHWKSFNEQKKELESIVGKDFKKTVEKFESDGKIKIEKFDVEYKPECQNLGINVIELQVLDKNFPFSSIFASHFDSRLDPKIKEFRDKYNVNYIGYSIKCISH